jgi:peptide/nickel transport system permease protein
MRSSILEVYRADFITTARSKGQVELKVIQKHMVPNAILPIITSIGMILSNNIAGSPVIEQVFSIPGVGQYLVTGINNYDYPVVRACVLFFAAFTSIVMLLVDLVYAALDPRIKARFVGGGGK